MTVEDDDGRRQAIEAATAAIAEAAEEFATSPEVFAQEAIDAAYSSGGIWFRQAAQKHAADMYQIGRNDGYHDASPSSDG